MITPSRFNAITVYGAFSCTLTKSVAPVSIVSMADSSSTDLNNSLVFWVNYMYMYITLPSHVQWIKVLKA